MRLWGWAVDCEVKREWDVCEAIGTFGCGRGWGRVFDRVFLLGEEDSLRRTVRVGVSWVGADCECCVE